MTTKHITVTLTNGFKFEAELTETDNGWKAYLPHTNTVGHGYSQKDAIVDALNEGSAGL